MTVDEPEYHKVMREREARIRTFMQLELEACLEEVNWIIRCHNCEALNCPQEEYPARLLPTPPPSYIDNLESRLIKAQKGIFPASLQMILKLNYHLPVRRPAPKNSVQPDDVIEGHRPGRTAHSHSVIHRRDAPRSIRGQRNPESRDGRPRSVRGHDPEYREPKRKWKRKNFPLLKLLYGWFFAFKLHKHRAGVYSTSSTRHRNGRQQRDNPKTSRRSRGVRETNEEAAAARNGRVVNRSKQAVWPWSVKS